MGCNCRKKKKVGPLGVTTTTTTKAFVKKPMEGRVEKFELRHGRTTYTFGSELEAKAAQRRVGGGTVRSVGRAGL